MRFFCSRKRRKVTFRTPALYRASRWTSRHGMPSAPRCSAPSRPAAGLTVVVNVSPPVGVQQKHPVSREAPTGGSEEVTHAVCARGALLARAWPVEDAPDPAVGHHRVRVAKSQPRPP
eukprot:2784499-Prymnesium_polylepis.2